MFCEHCGKQLREQSVFCPYCGIKVGSEEEVTMQPAGNAAEPQVQPAEHTAEQAVQMHPAASEQGTSAQSEVYVATADGVVPKGQQKEAEEDLPETHMMDLCSHEDFMKVIYNCFIKGASKDYLEGPIKKETKGRFFLNHYVFSPDGRYRLYVETMCGCGLTRSAIILDLETKRVWQHEYVLMRKLGKATAALIKQEEQKNVL